MYGQISDTCRIALISLVFVPCKAAKIGLFLYLNKKGRGSGKAQPKDDRQNERRKKRENRTTRTGCSTKR